jgi:hypothetical protein
MVIYNSSWPYRTRFKLEIIVDGIRNYHIPPEEENYTAEINTENMDIDPSILNDSGDAIPKTTSTLRLFPPPLFTRQGLPQNYLYVSNFAI